MGGGDLCTTAGALLVLLINILIIGAAASPDLSGGIAPFPEIRKPLLQGFAQNSSTCLPINLLIRWRLMLPVMIMPKTARGRSDWFQYL